MVFCDTEQKITSFKFGTGTSCRKPVLVDCTNSVKGRVFVLEEMLASKLRIDMVVNLVEPFAQGFRGDESRFQRLLHHVFSQGLATEFAGEHKGESAEELSHSSLLFARFICKGNQMEETPA